MNPLVEILKNQYPSSWDMYNDYVASGINFNSFAWILLILVIEGNKWKNNKTIYIMFIIFISCYVSKFIEITSIILFPKQYKEYGYEYSSNEGYKWSHAISRVIIYTGSIVGDWYLLIRTKTFVKSNRKIIWVFIACIFYNMTTLMKIYINFKYVPFKDNFDPVNDKLDYYTRKLEYKKIKWFCDLTIQLASICYDITVLITLKRNIFNNFNYDNVINGKSKGSLLIVKFQLLSEYRIYLTVMFSLFASPLIFLFCLKLLMAEFNEDLNNNPENKIEYIKVYCNDNDIENIRKAFMNLSYILIFIDQIMLKYLARNYDKRFEQHRNRKIYINDSVSNNNSNNNISVTNNKSKNKYKKYHNNNNTCEDIENQSLISDYYYNNNNNNNVDFINKNKIKYIIITINCLNISSPFTLICDKHYARRDVESNTFYLNNNDVSTSHDNS
ncbi:hypothetical protein BCR32DRAFT_295298 [Anaeromyces robustus]|uniref:Uncharacterized protein n=1 Tax=Anaeromyces robustus TaxID=1754192 RepID=A0A1Y1WWN6_9FUNG|nr:hypothetical protein BCR32DRAFT_295298 [Anaeromyces robustus]|eukprot:ORX77961.1 hypothetical protein BCR32DRAFT_295298 [Anaeromyces robustus]